MKGVLEGIKVIECVSHSYQACVAGAMLGDLGADVIHVEEPVKGDPLRGLHYLSGLRCTLPDGSNTQQQLGNHGKRSLTLNLKEPEARQILYRLIKEADVFLCSFRQHAIRKLEIEYATLSRHNPNLIYAHASGFGPKGPDSSRPVHDYIGQARSGFMHMVGDRTSPPTVYNVAVMDQIGGIMLAYGVLAALVARERHGIGQELDVSQLGAAIFLQGQAVGFYLMKGHELPRFSRAEAPSPLWNHYRCRDGKWIVLGVAQTERHWPDICRALGIEHLEYDPRFSTGDSRRENRAALIDVFDKVFAARDSSEWAKILAEKGDFPFSLVSDYSDVASDPQAILNSYITELDHPSLGKMPFLGYPVSFEKTPLAIRGPAPELGQHTEELLLDSGYSWSEINELSKKGII